MKWTPAQLKQNLANGAQNLPFLVLVYGDDAGAVRQNAKAVVEATGTDLDDPFLSDRISVEDLANNTGALRDSASTMGFGGGIRLVRLEGVNGDLTAPTLKTVTEAVDYCLEKPLEGAVIVISAPGVEKSKALVQHVEKHKQAVSIRCFHDSSRDLSQVIRDFFNACGKSVAGDAMAFLTENLGNDREITLRELEKLDIYAGSEKQVTLEHCLNSVSSAPSVNIFKLCDAIGLRDKKSVDTYLQHMQEEGEDLFLASVMVLRHLRRLLKCKELMAKGLNADDAMKQLKPPVLFGKPEFMRQVNNYPLPRLKKLYQHFYKMQLESRQGTLPANHVFERGLLSLSL